VLRQGSEYRVRAARPAPAADDLRDTDYDTDELARRTRLPRAYPLLREQAEEVYEAAGAEGPLEKALALQQWFVEDGDFIYDLDVPPLRGDDALTRFVLEDRVGYCEYFAAAMAVMLRETGVPARVAVGFLPGRRAGTAEGDLDRYVVSTADAHAWVEVLFPEHGWVTFEPTPRSDEAQILPREGDLAPVQTERDRRLEEALDGGTGDGPVEDLEPEIDLPSTPETEDTTDDEVAASPSATSQQRGSGWLVLLASLAGVVAVASVVQGRRTSHEQRPARDRILTARDRLLAHAASLGSPRHRHETTAQALRRWDTQGRTSDARALSGPLQAASYGGEVDHDDAHRVERGVADVLAQLRAGTPRSRRLVAPVHRTTAGLADLLTRRVRGVWGRAAGPAQVRSSGGTTAG
jgi:hypothetical protein